MTATSPSIGILGVGHLISYLVPGLLRASPPPEILLSPRNRQRARKLAQDHRLRIAKSNAELIDSCDFIILSVRPFQVENALKNLAWRPEQTLISLCAGVTIKEIANYTGAASIIRALPVTAAIYGESPTSVFPDDKTVRSLFLPCGPVIALENEAQFEVASMFGAYYGWVQHMIGEMADWAKTNGLEADAARLVAAQMTRAAATIVREKPETEVHDLVEELCLPESITGLGLDKLKQDKAFQPWKQAGDLVLHRLKR